MTKAQTRNLKERLMRWAPVLIILVAFLITGFILLRKYVIPSGSSSAVASLASCKDTNTLTCYKEYLTGKVQRDGPLAAINEIKSVAKSDPYAGAQCHELTHIIGHEGFEKYGSISTAYSKGEGYCWSGYYHGVTEEAIGKMGAQKVKEIANDICADLAATKKYSFDHFNCVHGLGHGFMAVDSFNLFNALKTCDLLHDNWERESCYGGVFMENVMVAVRGDGTSMYLKPDQPLYPCTEVETTYKQQCYLMQTSYALKQNGYNFAETFRLCRDMQDSDFSMTCYHSIGRDASGASSSNIAKTKASCEQAPSAEALEECVVGALKDFVSYYHSDKQALEFCAAFAEPLQGRCKEQVDAYYRTF